MEEKRYDEGNREGRQANINPDAVDYQHPAKKDQAREKVDIKESELGRETSQTPGNEQMEPMDQIDDGTKKLQQDKADDGKSESQDTDK